MGIGFAIPISMAKQVMDEIIRSGKVVRGWIGVTIQDVNEATAEALGLGGRKGVLVSDVYEDQPAAQAGLRRGDVILALDGQNVESANQLRNSIATLRPGQEVALTVLHNGRPQRLMVKVKPRSERVLARLAGEHASHVSESPGLNVRHRLGLEVAELSPALRQKYGIGDDVKGVAVVAADQSLADERAGLQPGDVIQQAKTQTAGFRHLESLADFDAFVKDVRGGEAVLLLLHRGVGTFYVAFTHEGPLP
jgi:serine protease Do